MDGTNANDVYQFRGTGLQVAEKRWAEKRFADYRTNYPHLHKMSDLFILEELVFQEALQERFKKKLGAKGGDPNNALKTNFQRQLSHNLEVQFKLKEKLGLFEDKKILDAFKDFQGLEDKFADYRRQNPDLFKTTCPRCAFEYYLKRRTTDYEPLTNAWFKDKVLFNYALFQAYKEQRPLTKKDLADILGVSDFYIDWLEERFLAAKATAESPATVPQE